VSDIRYWIGLTLVPEVGPVISRKLLASMGSPENIFSAGLNDLLTINGLSSKVAKNIKSFQQWDQVEKKVKIIERRGIKIIAANNPEYPEVLKELPDAPIILYMKGDYQPDDRFGIAIVGSRKHTEYGEAAVLKIAGELSSAGFTIISGMARGIDSLAHKSALSSGGRTIAVFGTGLDICYPAENKGLMEKIAESGCVMSEFPPGTKPNRENFPRRNRLISGLSLGVLVVEATVDSGSLITANYALEQNKEVFALPGNITSVSSEGPNRLIKQGAKIVLDAEDIIEELAPMLRGFIKAKKSRPVKMSEEENSLCNFMTREPKHVDILSRESGLSVHGVLDLLLSMELKGIVRQSNGKRFYLS
jgi:DNA processing protein